MPAIDVPPIDEEQAGNGSIEPGCSTRLLPGVLMASSLAALAFGLHLLPGFGLFSPMILAVMLGMAIHNLAGTPSIARSGLALCTRPVLRLGIVLLGLQLTLSQLADVGLIGLAVIASAVIATFVFTTWFGRFIGVDGRLAELLAAGTSICGASAIIAANVVTKAPEEDVAYAVASVTLFGCIAMFAYPLLSHALNLEPYAYGLWTGASVHEVSQVVAASFQLGQEAGEIGTVTKLSRVLMLAPLVIALGLVAVRSDAGAKAGARPPVPWFVIGFIGLVLFNSVIALPPEAREVAVWAAKFLLAVGLAAIGLETSFGRMRTKGLKPLALGAASSIFIAAFSLILIKLSG